MTLPKISSIKGERILVDSCVLIYSGDDLKKVQIGEIIKSLTANDNKLAISELSIFEVQKNVLNEGNRTNYNKVLLSFDTVPVHKRALMNAARLSQKYGTPKDHGDHLIGGTAICHEALILSADQQHGFSRNHWVTVATEPLIYIDQGHTRVINIDLLKYKEDPDHQGQFFTRKDWVSKDPTNTDNLTILMDAGVDQVASVMNAPAGPTGPDGPTIL